MAELCVTGAGIHHGAVRWRGVPASHKESEDALTKQEKFVDQANPSQGFG